MEGITSKSLNRRSFLMAGAACLLPIPSWATPNPSREGAVLDQIVGRGAVDPFLEMWNQNTNERIKVRFFDGTGYDHAAIERINWFMRDWREKETKMIDVRLLWALATLRRAGMKEGFSGEIRFLSGYRSKKTNNYLRNRSSGVASNSFHILARANDFSLPGIPIRSVFEYSKYLGVGGVGHYPGSFVHIDSGERRSWGG